MATRSRSAASGDDGGGFFPPGTASNANGLLSPMASTASSSVASSVLPKPRSHPLKSGSAKESTFINYMDREVMGVTRRFAKKFNNADDGAADGRGPAATATANASESDNAAATNGGETSHRRDSGGVKNEQGYSSFREVAQDMERLIAVLWVSGTPSLQIQYLLTLALLVVTYIPAFPPAPRSMFRTLEKLDYAFASLVIGRDLDTEEDLPGFGFGGRQGLSATEKVRVKSLVERTRVLVVEFMGNAGDINPEDEEEDSREENGDEAIDVDDLDGDWGMEMARVYDRTIVELGDTLGEGDIEMALDGD